MQYCKRNAVLQKYCKNNYYCIILKIAKCSSYCKSIARIIEVASAKNNKMQYFKNYCRSAIIKLMQYCKNYCIILLQYYNNKCSIANIIE